MNTYENLSTEPGGKVPASTQLRSTATVQENTLEAINKFKPTSNEYSATNPEVIDNQSIDDKYVSPLESVNFYSSTNEYKSPE